MFSLICIAVAGFLAAVSVKEYRFAAIVLFMEFTLHKFSHTFLFLDLRATNPVYIFVIYAVIQTVALWALTKVQTHFFLAAIIFVNLLYNSFLIGQYLGFTTMDFYTPKKIIYRIIMIIELLYLAGISSYASRYIKSTGSININYLDNLFCIKRKFSNGNIL